jgi:hypothetical protein
MNGPPPFKALMKAAEIEDAQKSEVKRLQEDKDAEESAAIASAAIGSVFGTDKERLDIFYPADRFWQLAISFGLGSNALLGYGSEELLQQVLPSFAMSIREYLTPGLIRNIFQVAVVIHLLEASVALNICLKRGWYSPLNILKWTGSTALYGFASMSKLVGHGKKVKKAAKKAN